MKQTYSTLSFFISQIVGGILPDIFTFLKTLMTKFRSLLCDSTYLTSLKHI